MWPRSPASPSDTAQALHALLSGGDDYELLFTAPPGKCSEVLTLATTLAIPLKRIGRITAASGLTLESADGTRRPIAARGFDHFPG